MSNSTRSRQATNRSAASTPPVKGRARAVTVAYAIAYLAIVVLFGACALALIVLACTTLWPGINPASGASHHDRFQAVLEGIGLLTVAVASLELSQTVLEEEVQRETSMSTPTRARRFLSRFMLVVVVSLAVEFLVFVFEAIHTDSSRMFHAAALGAATAALMIGWACFVRFNAHAEELEPEAMEEVKREDENLG